MHKIVCTSANVAVISTYTSEGKSNMALFIYINTHCVECRDSPNKYCELKEGARNETWQCVQKRMINSDKFRYSNIFYYGKNFRSNVNLFLSDILLISVIFLEARMIYDQCMEK